MTIGFLHPTRSNDDGAVRMLADRRHRCGRDAEHGRSDERRGQSFQHRLSVCVEEAASHVLAVPL
jgi:hypothetical protein